MFEFDLVATMAKCYGDLMIAENMSQMVSCFPKCTCTSLLSYQKCIIVIVKNSNRTSVFKVNSSALSELSWITPKSKEIFSVSVLISFIEIHVFEEHHRNEIGINIIGYLISDTT